MSQWFVLPSDSSRGLWEPFFCCPGAPDPKFSNAGVPECQETWL